MTLYQPARIENWIQVFLNGFLRPHRFFVLSKWKARPFESAMVILFSIGCYSLLFQKALMESINWYMFWQALLIGGGMALLFPMLLHYFKSSRGWSIYGVFSSYLCFLSYVFVCFLMTTPLAFIDPYYFMIAQGVVLIWSVYGFSQSFLNLNFSDGYKAIAMYLIFFVASFMLIDQKHQLVNYINIAQNKVVEIKKIAALSVQDEFGMSRKGAYTKVIQLPRFKKSHKFVYNFQFRKGKHAREGFFEIYVLGYDADYNVANIKVKGKYAGIKKSFKQELRLNQPSKDISYLMKTQKWGVNTATRILFSSYSSAVMLPQYAMMKGYKERQKLKVIKSKYMGMSSYDIVNLPGLWPKSRYSSGVNMNISLSPSVPLPVQVSGHLPKNKGFYKIKLVSMK